MLSFSLNDNKDNESDNKQSPYKIKPKLTKLNYTQFEAMFPMVSQFDRYLTDLVSYTNQEVVVEFNLYIQYIIENIDLDINKNNTTVDKIVITDSGKSAITKVEEESDQNEFKDIPFIHYEGIKADAKKVNSLIEIINTRLKDIILKTEGSKPSRQEFYKLIPSQVKNAYKRMAVLTPSTLSDLWKSFLMNIAIMNIRSIILCAENANTNLSKIPLVPIKFIPKLGSELSILYLHEENLTLDDVREKIISGEIEDDEGYISYIGSLSLKEQERFLDLTLFSKPEQPQKYATQFGYTSERFNQAQMSILNSSTFGHSLIEDCEEFLDNRLEYISILGCLYSELKTLNSSESCVLLDFMHK